jgi:hypothetical protein
VVELRHDFANGARAGNARWQEMLRLADDRKCIDDDQKSAPNAFIEQLTALSEDLGNLGEQETLPNREVLAGLKIPWRFYAAKLDQRLQSTPESRPAKLPRQSKKGSRQLTPPF